MAIATVLESQELVEQLRETCREMERLKAEVFDKRDKARLLRRKFVFAERTEDPSAVSRK
ncbi:MAG: hypothetical protein NVS9B15_21040 [Acidobacteriaceae bacterium]